MKDQKDKIVDIALDSFKQFGIRSVSIDDICKSLSMSKKTFYVFFQCKEDLIKAVLDKMNANVEKGINDFLNNKSALECIKCFITKNWHLPDVHQDPPFKYDLKKYYPQIYKEHTNRINIETKNVLMRHLQQGKEEGIYREDLDVEMCAIMYSFVQQAYIRNEDSIRSVSPKRLARFTLDSFMRSILSAEGCKIVNEITKNTCNNDKM